MWEESYAFAMSFIPPGSNPLPNLMVNMLVGLCSSCAKVTQLKKCIRLQGKLQSFEDAL